MKKTLVIYPGSATGESVFYLLDPETGEVLASHLCSFAGFAPGDLHDHRQERLDEWRERYGMETECKFIDETDYDWSEIYKKNQELAKQKA